MKKNIVLIIDDEENVLNSLKRLLRKEPYSVITTTSPKKALKFLERMKVSLIITDQKMDEISGEEVIRQAAQICPETDFMVLTGYSDTMGKVQSSAALIVVQKPWNDDELKQLIRKTLDTDNYSKVLTTVTNQEEYICSSTESL